MKVTTRPALSILIVDDDETLAANLRDILQEEGYTVTVAPNGKTATDLCMTQTFGLALVDIKLPDTGGVQLIEKLNRECPDAPETIMITGYATVDSAIAAVRQEKIIAYETKPLNMDFLLSFIRQVEERKRTEETLRQNEAQLRLILGQIPCVLMITDQDLVITSSLGSNLQDLDNNTQPVISMTLSKYFRNDDPDFAPMVAHRHALDGKPANYELMVGERTLYGYVEPLREGDRIVGVISLALDITERKHIEEEHQAMSRRLVEIQEAERRDIARELHDQLGQTLTGLKIMLGAIAGGAAKDPDAQLTEAQRLVSEMLTQVRDMSLNLRPSMLDDLGLLPTLNWHIQRYTNQTQVRVDFRHKGLDRKFPEDVTNAAFRIVQESLTNVARHSQANSVQLRAWADDALLSLTIEDNGKGFNPGVTTRISGGLNGMKERAMLVNGQLLIESTPGAGTRITVELPIMTPGKKGRKTKNDKHSPG